MTNTIEYLEHLSRHSNNQCWVIIFDGKIISGATHRAFDSLGNAKKSFSHLIRSSINRDKYSGNINKSISISDIRKQLEKEGRLKFKNFGESW